MNEKLNVIPSNEGIHVFEIAVNILIMDPPSESFVTRQSVD